VKTYVVDMHALFWYLTASPRLSARAKDAFDEGKRSEARVCIPAIVLAELFSLPPAVIKRRIPRRWKRAVPRRNAVPQCD
jgi:hypothetical protein